MDTRRYLLLTNCLFIKTIRASLSGGTRVKPRVDMSKLIRLDPVAEQQYSVKLPTRQTARRQLLGKCQVNAVSVPHNVQIALWESAVENGYNMVHIDQKVSFKCLSLIHVSPLTTVFLID